MMNNRTIPMSMETMLKMKKINSVARITKMRTVIKMSKMKMVVKTWATDNI